MPAAKQTPDPRLDLLERLHQAVRTAHRSTSYQDARRAMKEVRWLLDKLEEIDAVTH